MQGLRNKLVKSYGQLQGLFFAEKERWNLWWPVFMAIGILWYFALKHEPSFAITITAASGILVLLSLSIAFKRYLPITLLLLAVFIGFAAAQIKTTLVATPMLQLKTRTVMVEGTVETIETLANGYRFLLRDVQIEKMERAETPQRVRIKWAGKKMPPASGNRIKLLAILSPPSEPTQPGAYNFRRQAFFDGLGAVGFALSDPIIVAENGYIGAFGKLHVYLENMRQVIAEHIEREIQTSAKGIVHALMTGEQTAIPKDVMDAMRISGLAHILSISGMHIGMVAGFTFFVIRALLALFQSIALRFNIKKIAALAAIVIVILYTILVGAPIPAQRSAMMSIVALLAIMVDRSAISLRILSFAATLILLFSPESLLNISFQMSFAAVVALVAAYEAIPSGFIRWGRRFGVLGFILAYSFGIAFSSLIASLATAPLSVYHFQQLTGYGIVSNMLAAPITGTIVMPSILAAYVVIPFGLDGFFLRVAGFSTDLIIWIAKWISTWGGAFVTVPAISTVALLVVVCGGLWLCLWSKKWRYLGVLAMFAGIVAAFFSPRPDIIISNDGKLIAVRDADGRLFFSSNRTHRFEAKAWEQRDGQPRSAETWPTSGKSGDGTISCDYDGCIYFLKGKEIAILKNADGALEDCVMADIVISERPLPACHASQVFDKWRLRDGGTHTIIIGEGGGLQVSSVADETGQRPWSVKSKTNKMLIKLMN